jgi:hypothetical protein
MTSSNGSLPKAAGIGLKPEHISDILSLKPPIGFIEVHAENYMGDGGPPHRFLGLLRQLYPLSLHGVALSLGGTAALDRQHLKRLKSLIDRYQPQSFSEHLAWSTHDGVYLNDLLPLPYTERTLRQVCDHIDETQEFLGERLLLENPSTYVRFAASEIPETEFLAEIAARTGCGLLLDINNVFVSARNHGFAPEAYLAVFPMSRVGEIHLAGHVARHDTAGLPILIDSHDTPVADPVWHLFDEVIASLGPMPALIERDANVPRLPDLLAEMRFADAIMHRGSADAERLVEVV